MMRRPMHPADNDLAAKAARLKRAPDDMAMMRAAAELTRDLNTRKSAHLLGRFPGFGADRLCRARRCNIWQRRFGYKLHCGHRFGAGALPRRQLHPRSHPYQAFSAVPGFRFGFNAVIGVPMLVPSYMYEGVHNLHHARTRYGTDQDPEYLPLGFDEAVDAAGVHFRVAAGAHCLAVPQCGARTVVACSSRRCAGWWSSVIRASSSTPPSAAVRPKAKRAATGSWQETAASIWAIALLTGVFTGVIPLTGVSDFPRHRRRALPCSIRSAHWSRICGRMTASR